MTDINPTDEALKAVSDYKDIAALGGEVAYYFRESDYQGRWVAVVREPEGFALLLGWFGSCSACDAIEAVGDYNDDVQSNEMRGVATGIWKEAVRGADIGPALEREASQTYSKEMRDAYIQAATAAGIEIHPLNSDDD